MLILPKKVSKIAQLAKSEIENLLPQFQFHLHLYVINQDEVVIDLIKKSNGNVFVKHHGYDSFLTYINNTSKVEVIANLAIEISSEILNKEDCYELLQKTFDTFPQTKITLLLKPQIKSIDQFLDWKKEFSTLQELFLNTKSNLITFTFIVLPTNYLFVDDARMWSLQNGGKKIDFYPDFHYFLSSNNENVTEFFHVKMFFDALTHEKSMNFQWRNFFRNFALNNIPIEKSYYQIYSGAKGLLSPITDFTNKQLSNKNLIALPNKSRQFGESPALGLKTVTELFSSIVSSKVKPIKQDIWSHNPILVSEARSTVKLNVKDWKTVLITGWYGTETQGDKAIIGEVLHFIKSASPDCKIILTTLHNAISEQTNLELKDLDGVELIRLEKGHLTSIISQTDAVIVGGGPLMESASMKDIGNIFVEAYKQNIPRIIFGCGIGPIHSPEVERVTRYLLSVCNAGFVRDKESYDFANKLFPDHNLKFACDPAVGFVSRWRKENKVVYIPKNNATIATLLRANTNEFSPESNPEKLMIANELLAQKMAVSLDNIADKTGASYELLHMNAPWVGGDDRIYNRILSAQLAPTTKVNLVREYLTLEEHMKVLSYCNAALAMRYHGHIFCMAMGIPFLSLDYTGKSGKVSSLVNRIGYGNWSIKWDEIDPISMTELYEKLMLDSEEWSAYLISEADKLVLLLHQTYQEVFNYCPEN